jgi:O-antigen/teichoic acid export membrane protein
MFDLRIMSRQSFHCILGYAVSLIAGFVSLPIYTRLFKVSDYGILSLISTIVFFVMSIGKLGKQNSTIRFYDEVRNNKKTISLKYYYSTLFFGPLVIVAAVSTLYAFTIIFLRIFLLRVN